MDILDGIDMEAYPMPIKKKRRSKVIRFREHRNRPKPVTVVRTFNCYYKNEPMQAIQYSNGTYKVGFDVLRLLDKHDFPSYPVREFKNQDDFYNFCEERREEPKSYLMEEKDGLFCKKEK